MVILVVNQTFVYYIPKSKTISYKETPDLWTNLFNFPFNPLNFVGFHDMITLSLILLLFFFGFILYGYT